MEMIDKIFSELEEAKEKSIIDREDHIKRVRLAIDWFMSDGPYFQYLDDNKCKYSFKGTHVAVNEEDCICISYDLMYPNAKFNLVPSDFRVDMGSGRGANFVKEF